MESIIEELVFTRYLYPKLYVKHSILLSLLDNKYDESLFWSYELYFSGFQEEVFQYIFYLYGEIYKECNPKFIEAMDSLYKEWNENVDKDYLLGTIVGTLSHMNYRIDSFMKKKYNVNCKSSGRKSKKTIIITCKQENIIKYYTMAPYEKSYKYLRNVGLLPIRTNIKNLFQEDYGNIKNEFYYNWLYYAVKSPVWSERINDFKGTINNYKKCIEFLSEEWEEGFYNTWGLEPDEQCQEIQDILIGKVDSEQICIKDFCEKFGSPVIIKKITRSKNN